MKNLIEQLESTTNAALVELRRLYNRYDYAKWRYTEYESELNFMADHPDWVSEHSKKTLTGHLETFGYETDIYLEKIAELEPIVECLEKALAAAKEGADILLQHENNNSEDKTNE